jgi:hypothetical protein
MRQSKGMAGRASKRRLRDGPPSAEPGVGAQHAAPLPSKGGAARSRVTSALIGAALALAFALRMWGLGWGLPNKLHYFSYHPDETANLWACTPELGGLDLPNGQLLPHFYNYGTFYLYLSNFAISASRTVGIGGPVMDANGDLRPRNLAATYYAARLVTALMGTATVWVVFAIGGLLWGPTAGILAALSLALFPLHAQHSHFFTVDAPMTLLLCLALLFACRTQQGIYSERRGAVYVAIAAGLAAATKYIGGMALLALVVALVARRRAAAARTARLAAAPGLPGTLALALAITAVTYLAACPGTVLEWPLFLHHVKSMFINMRGTPDIQFINVGPGWLYIIQRNLSVGLGPVMLLLALAGLGYAAWRREPGDAVLASFGVPYYLLMAVASSLYARYDVPLLPLLALWIGRLLADGVRRVRVAHLALRAAAIALIAAAFAFTLAHSVTILLPMGRTDPRDQAGRWLARNAPMPTRIGFATKPWFWTPPITPMFPFPAAGPFRAFASEQEMERYVFNLRQPFDAKLLAASRPAVVVMSEFEYADRLRLKNPAAAAYFEVLRRDYAKPIIFRAAHPLLGPRSIDGLPTQGLPHDMLYPSPAILIYRRADL